MKQELTELEQAKSHLAAMELALECARKEVARIEKEAAQKDGAALLDAMLPLKNGEFNASIFDKGGILVAKVICTAFPASNDKPIAAEIAHRCNHYPTLEKALQSLSENGACSWSRHFAGMALQTATRRK